MACYQPAGMRHCAACDAIEHRCNENPYNGRCTRERVRVHIHHIKPKRYGGKNNPENLIPLCSKCHMRTHKYYEDEALKSVLRHSPEFFEACLETVLGGHVLRQP